VLTDQAGNSVECDGTVMVKDSIGPVADAGTDIFVKQGTTVVLNGSMSTDNIGITNWTWRWEEGPEEVVLEGMQVSFRFDKVGAYTVELAVIDGSGNEGTDTITVEVESSDEKGGSYLVYFLLTISFMMFVTVSLYFLIIKRKNLEWKEEDGKGSQEGH
jgi:hypothetical protein